MNNSPQPHFDPEHITPQHQLGAAISIGAGMGSLVTPFIGTAVGAVVGGAIYIKHHSNQMEKKRKENEAKE